MSSFTAIAVCTFLTIIVCVHSHGFMVDPDCRGSLNSNSVKLRKPRHELLRNHTFKDYSNLADKVPSDSCIHCGNAGGKGAVMKSAGGKWRPYQPLNKNVPFRRDHGMCGDEYTKPVPRNHEAGGLYGFPKSPIVKDYKVGETVEFMIDITTSHNGYFSFYICDADKCGGDINEKCFKDGHCHSLKRALNPVCEDEKSKECGPVDDKFPGRWYMPCRKGDHVGEHFMGGPFMKYKLPAGFQTNHAVIQWYWVTANACNPPGFLDYFKRHPLDAWGKCPGDGGAMGGRNPTFGECGGSVFPEEFWGCADVSVGKTGPPEITVPIAQDTSVDVVPSTQPSVASTMTPAPAAASVDATVTPTPSVAVTVSDAQMVASATPEPAMSVEPKPSGDKVLMVRKGVGKKMIDGSMKECAISFEQCGGEFYKGPPNCCDESFSCQAVNKYYSQCKKMKA